MSNLEDFFNQFQNVQQTFDEIPVPLEEFVSSKDYLDFGELSDEQYSMIKAASQIYRKETLYEIFKDPKDVELRWSQTCDQIIAAWGKGSGKDEMSAIACCYVVYLLLCLRDPQAYFGKPKDDAIDIINVAINAKQAREVFFVKFTNRVKNCKWFAGKYRSVQDKVIFDKSVTVYSGHSEAESQEGYNLILAVLDEISGFPNDTGKEIHGMFRESVTSRFREGKVLLLSFPRSKSDYISQMYDEVVAEKNVVEYSYTFKRNEDLPDGIESNEFTIHWTEDTVLSYNEDRTYATKKPSWVVNPTKDIKDYKKSFDKNYVEAMTKFAVNPPDAIGAFFKDKGKIERAFSKPNKLNNDGSFDERYQPDPDKVYFIHVDLAHKHDNCVLAMSHVDKWVQPRVGSLYSEVSPHVETDIIKIWQPTTDKNVDFGEVRKFILSLKARGYNIKLVTFDGWQSIDSINFLNEQGIKADRLPVGKKHYDDLALLIMDDRIEGPDIKLLRDDLLSITISDTDKIVRPRTSEGHADVADALVGSAHNAVAHTRRDLNQTIEVYTASSFKETNVVKPKPQGVITPPPIPKHIEEFLTDIKIV